MFHFESRNQTPISRTAFLRRLGHSFFVCLMLVGVSLFVGMLGYHGFEGMSWTDSFLNASMILGGMGPVGEIRSTAGKLFAAAFALYAGLVFLAVAGILLVPVLHRLMHKVHLEQGHPGH